MIRRSTWVIVIVFVLVIGVAVLVEKTPYFQPSPTPSPTIAPVLFPGQVTAFTLVDSAGPTVSVRLDTNKTWVALQPPGITVDQGNMAELITQFVGIEIISAPQTPPPADATGLKSPVDTITFTDTKNQEHTLNIGSKTPTSSGYYVQLDQGKPVIVSTDTIDRIVQLLSGVTATPTAPPSLTASPTGPITTETPTPTATP